MEKRFQALRHIDWTQTGSTTPDQSEVKNNGNEEALHITKCYATGDLPWVAREVLLH